MYIIIRYNILYYITLIMRSVYFSISNLNLINYYYYSIYNINYITIYADKIEIIIFTKIALGIVINNIHNRIFLDILLNNVQVGTIYRAEAQKKNSTSIHGRPYGGEGARGSLVPPGKML